LHANSFTIGDMFYCNTRIVLAMSKNHYVNDSAVEDWDKSDLTETWLRA